MHIALLLAWLQGAIGDVVMGMEENSGDGGWTTDRKVEVLRALAKFWWLQNDLFARHYCDDWDLMKGESKRKGWWEKSAIQIAMVGAAAFVTGAILPTLLLSY